MAAGKDRSSLRFYVDETSMGLGKAMAMLRRDVVHPGHRLLPEVPPGTKDVDWMPVVSGLGLVVISRDKRIRTKPAELAAFRDSQLRVLWIAGKRDLSNWDSLARLVRHWVAIEEVIVDRNEGPWGYAVNSGGLKEVQLRRP